MERPNDRRRLLPVVDAAAEWRARLTWLTTAWILFLGLTGLALYLLPFSEFTQFSLLVHTIVGVVLLVPVLWYSTRHFLQRYRGKLSHYQVTGYVAVGLLLVCIVSGLVLTYEGLFSIRRSYVWHLIHLLTGLTVLAATVVHLIAVAVRPVAEGESRQRLRQAQGHFAKLTIVATFLAFVPVFVWMAAYETPDPWKPFPEDYNWRFGEDRPFAPSNARADYSEWIESFTGEIAALLSEEQAERFQELLKDVAYDINGPFARVRSALAELEVGAEVREEAERIMKKAAHVLRQRGALKESILANSKRCGTSGCHEEIYREWLPSAHRYSSMDHMFQAVQEIMAKERSPEHTRYCAGCHDPISLLAGAKNPNNITLSVEGADEGSSCVVCHSIVQTDTQGNADYTIRPPIKYVYEADDGKLAQIISDFLIRTYPDHHIASYSRPLYKTPEYCAACHKQYIDTEVNLDIGRVQGQNQYDSWKNSRWNKGPHSDKTLECRECHMPLLPGVEPAAGDLVDAYRSPDDGLHRSHRFLAANQYMPEDLKLAGAKEHTELIIKWLRGEYEVPEIKDKWTEGPVVKMQLMVPEEVRPGEELLVRVVLTNNKTGHDFPTGPLDMIESWVELRIEDGEGKVLYHAGAVQPNDFLKDPLFWFKADLFDREGKLVDRHNLWDVVGAKYKRALYPGMTDVETIKLLCPSMARPRLLPADGRPGQRVDKFAVKLPEDIVGTELRVKAVLWYRKANPEFLTAVYGVDTKERSPRTAMTEAEARIKVVGYERLSVAK